MDREEFLDNFKYDCIMNNTTCLTDINNSYLTYNINCNYKCINNHEYKSTISNPKCQKCSELQKEITRKLESGMKVVNYNISEVKIVMEIIYVNITCI